MMSESRIMSHKLYHRKAKQKGGPVLAKSMMSHNIRHAHPSIVQSILISEQSFVTSYKLHDANKISYDCEWENTFSQQSVQN